MGGRWVFSLLVEGERLGLVALLLLLLVAEKVCGGRPASRGHFPSRLAIGLIWRLVRRSRAQKYRG